MDDLYQKYVDKCHEIIIDYGWMVQGVGTILPWTYTVGLRFRDRPELIIVGLPMDMATEILNSAAIRHLAERFVPGSLVDVGWSVRLQVKQVTAQYMNVYWAITGGLATDTAYQLIWPDQHGIYQEERQVIPDELRFTT